MSLFRLWHTLRWLKPAQFYGRARRMLVAPRPDFSPAPHLRSASGDWRRCPRQPSMTGPSTFKFHGGERRIGSPADWNRSDWPKLWLYNAHYFDDLVADSASDRSAWHVEVIGRWIAENPAGSGNGWEPYTISLRIVNWVKWALGGGALDERATHSIAVQVRYLARTLETHLLGSHLWANAKALIFAGTFFEGPECDSWRSAGITLMRREVPEQILGDGGHFELSPMYQTIILEDLLDLIQLARLYPGLFDDGDVQGWNDAAIRMGRWLLAMTHPDGGISFFNDAAMGCTPNLSELSRYAATIGLDTKRARWDSAETIHLSDSGYVRLQNDSAVVIADVARVGSDYVPGHGHADTLSFEFSLRGRRLLVNGGISTYEATPERLLQRGTAFHNTVEIDGANSSEVWSSFRVARRAVPFGMEMVERLDGLSLRASHDGYGRLRGKPMHSRSWFLAPRSLVVVDRVSTGGHSAIARFRLHPSWSISQEGFSGMIGDGAASCRWSVENARAVRVVAGTWSSGFGNSEPCDVIEVDFDTGPVVTEFSWE